jgi:hypothetical protein
VRPDSELYAVAEAADGASALRSESGLYCVRLVVDDGG